MNFLVGLFIACLAIAVVIGAVSVWVSDDDPAAHAERDAKETQP